MTEQDAMAAATAYLADKRIDHGGARRAIWISRHRFDPSSGAKDHWAVYFHQPVREDEFDRLLIHDPAEGVRFFALRSSRVRTRSLMVW